MSHSVSWFTTLATAFASTAALASPPLEPTWTVERHGEYAVVSLHVAATNSESVNVQIEGRNAGALVTLATQDLADALEAQQMMGMLSRAGSWPVWQKTEGDAPMFVGSWTFPVAADQTSLQVHGQVPTEEGTLPVHATLSIVAPGS